MVQVCLIINLLLIIGAIHRTSEKTTVIIMSSNGLKKNIELNMDEYFMVTFEQVEFHDGLKYKMALVVYLRIREVCYFY